MKSAEEREKLLKLNGTGGRGGCNADLFITI